MRLRFRTLLRVRSCAAPTPSVTIEGKRDVLRVDCSS